LALKTFIMVTFIWVFFRSQSFDDAIHILRLSVINHTAVSESLLVPVSTWFFLFVFIVSDILLYNKRFDGWVGKLPFILRWSVYSVLIFAVIVFAGVDNFPFIYFQF